MFASWRPELPHPGDSGILYRGVVQPLALAASGLALAVMGAILFAGLSGARKPPAPTDPDAAGARAGKALSGAGAARGRRRR